MTFSKVAESLVLHWTQASGQALSLDPLSLFTDESKPFPEKWQHFLEWAESSDAAGELSVYLADILVLQALQTGQQAQSDAYFDSPEWAEIESMTADDGSEWLNLFIYLDDCRQQSVEPSLEDFLHEFLLVEEEDFQVEAQIYEPLIEAEELADAPWKERLNGAKVLDSGDLEDLYLPLVVFLGEDRPTPTEVKEHLNPMEFALYATTYEAWNTQENDEEE